MRLGGLIVLLAMTCFSEEVVKPPCNAQNRGQLWPLESNYDHQAARRAERSGTLEICSPGIWKYRWQSLTVHVSQLGAASASEEQRRPARFPTRSSSRAPQNVMLVNR
jgi:hypothetical protein